jgi:hypothetical protein
MREHNRKGGKYVPEKGHSMRVGASVLLAAASLLGTSLGVSAATSDEPLGAGSEGSAGQKPTSIMRTAIKGGSTPTPTPAATPKSTPPPTTTAPAPTSSSRHKG